MRHGAVGQEKGVPGEGFGGHPQRQHRQAAGPGPGTGQARLGAADGGVQQGQQEEARAQH